MDQPPAVAVTAFAGAWPRAIEMEIGATLCATLCTIGHGKRLELDIWGEKITYFNREILVEQQNLAYHIQK